MRGRPPKPPQLPEAREEKGVCEKNHGRFSPCDFNQPVFWEQIPKSEESRGSSLLGILLFIAPQADLDGIDYDLLRTHGYVVEKSNGNYKIRKRTNLSTG